MVAFQGRFLLLPSHGSEVESDMTYGVLLTLGHSRRPPSHLSPPWVGGGQPHHAEGLGLGEGNHLRQLRQVAPRGPQGFTERLQALVCHIVPRQAEGF